MALIKPTPTNLSLFLPATTPGNYAFFSSP